MIRRTRIKMKSEFLPIPNQNFDPSGRIQTKTHHKFLWLTARFFYQEGKMKSLALLIILLVAFKLFPQADLTIDLLLYDNGNPPYGGSAEISFGLDSTATDGIDPHLGEMQYPPDICPTWWPYFCAKFILPPFNSYLDSPKDFRFGELPFTGQKEHRIFCVSDDTIITIEYNLPSGVILNLSDVFGGVLFNETLADSGEVTLLYDYFISGQIRMFVDYDNVVTVELTSFTASVLQNEKAVQLNWTTATEINNSGFEIQRKESGVRSQESEYEVIGFVPGFGTTTESKSYSFIDEEVTTGNYKYRLKQIDFDGSFEYSNEIEVAVDFTPKEFVLYQNYPNPFNPSTTIKYEIPNVGTRDRVSVRIIVYDILGNEVATLVNEEKQPGVYEVEFGNVRTSRDLSLPSGIYFYQLKAENFTSIKKMVLLR